MNNRALPMEEILSIVDGLMSLKKDEGLLVSLATQLALLDENGKHDLAQYLTQDNGLFDRSTPDILASLFDYCKWITGQQAAEASESGAAIFLMSVLSKYPKLLKKNLEIRLRKILLTIQLNHSDDFFPTELDKLDAILVSLENSPTLDKITKELFQSLCQKSHDFNALIQLQRRCKDSFTRAGRWLYQNTTEENLGIYTFSTKKTRFDARLPDVITLLIYQKTFKEQASLRQFYEIYGNNDILPTTKMMKLGRIASKHTGIIKAHDLRTQAIDLGIRRQAVLYIFDILLLREANKDYSRLLNPIKKADMNHPSVTNILNQIETKLILSKMSVAVVMQDTIRDLLFALLDDVRDLLSGWSKTPSLSGVMLTLMQCLLTNQYSFVLRYIHTQITTQLPVVFGREVACMSSDIMAVIDRTISAINYMQQECFILYTIENNFDSILENIESVTTFLQQIYRIRFETTYPDGLKAKIDAAAEMYIQQKILSLNTTTSRRCKKFYNNNQNLGSFQKLQEMGCIAFKRTGKSSKSQYHELYQEISVFRYQDSENDLDNSNHSVYSESSRLTTFSLPATPPRKMTPLEPQEGMGHNLTNK